MIKAGDRVIYNEQYDCDECEGIPSLKTVEEVIETKNNIYYKLYGINGLIFEDGIEEILPEKKDGLYVTVGYDPELIKGVRDTISEAVCELQEYATNEHSYYTADGKEMLSTWKQKGDHVYDVHTFEKVSPSNWKQLS
ncbi:hypothetical protein [Fusobacterium ulcerans]|uniref:hypothetical protein n=1 Tax=Fusobacterium ulcerans TaxID=861 RepID=UPI0030B38450